MRTLTAAQIQVLTLREYQACVRVLVDDGTGTSTFNDLTQLAAGNWQQSIKWSETMDNHTGNFTITLLRESYQKSLAPLVTGSMLNNLTGSYLPVLAVGRAIKIQTAVIPLGAVPQAGDWIDSFEGQIDTLDPGKVDYQIEIDGRDLGGPVADRVAEVSLLIVPTGSEVLETCMQDDVIDQIFTPPGGGLDPTAPTLYVPSSPGWTLDTQGKLDVGQGCLDQLSQMAEQIGWDVRYLWDNVSSSFKLTLWEPVRSGPGVAETFQVFQQQDCQQAETDISWVRNVVSVAYGQTSPPAGVVGGGGYLNPFAPVVVESTGSIAKYGRRFCQIGLGATSNILDSTHATDLADAVLADLEDPIVLFQIDLAFRPEVMLGDYYTFKAPTPWFDEDISLGCYGIAHEFDLPGDEGDQARALTTLTVRGFPSGSINDWGQAIAGATGGNAPPVRDLEPDTISWYIAVALRGATAFSSIPNPNLIDWYETQAHVSTSAGFTPSASTLVDRGRKTTFNLLANGPTGTPLTVGTTYYARLIIVDKQGNQTILAALSFIAGAVGNVDCGSDLKQNFHAHEAGTFNVGNGAGFFSQAMDFDTVDFDTERNYSRSGGPPMTGFFTAQATAPGKYLINTQIVVPGLPAASGAQLRVTISFSGAGHPPNIVGGWQNAVDDPNNAGHQIIHATLSSKSVMNASIVAYISIDMNNIPANTPVDATGQTFFEAHFVPG